MRFLRHRGIYRSDVLSLLLNSGQGAASRWSGPAQAIERDGKSTPCPSSAMSSGWLILDRVARQHCPSPLHQRSQHKSIAASMETNYHRTVTSVLTGCLTQGGHPTSFLEHRGIAALAFKGPVAALAAYGDLALRQYQDIDLIVHDQDLLKTVNLLVFVDSRSQLVRAVLTIRKMSPVTMKSPWLRRINPTSLIFIGAWLRSGQGSSFRTSSECGIAWRPSSCLQEAFHTFCREDLFVALCCHGAKHRWGRLKWLLDIAEILRSPVDLNWNRVETITFERPLARAAISLAIFLSHDLLNAPMPAALPNGFEVTARTRSVAEGIRAEIFTHGRTPGIDHNHTTLPELEGSILAWIQYLWATYPRWFFEHAIVRIDAKDRKLISLPQQLDFLYYIVRPIRLVAKHSMRVARLAELSIRR